MNAFPNLTFIDPIEMRPVPYSNRLLVAEKAGRLTVFDNNPGVATKTVLLDIRHQTQSTHDSGLLGCVLHPEFGVPSSPNRHYLYVYYRYTPQKTDNNRAYCRLSRFTWDPATNSISPSSEFVLINQYNRHNWHNGGGIFFGPDGFLYLSIGDEGGANDQYNSGQRMDTGLLAGVLRIDVDRDPTRSHPIRRQPRNPGPPPAGWPNSYSQGYFIPNDNPWQSPNGSHLEEFYAIGLRSPHRMTQDPVTGEIWVGDVGQVTREEVSLVPRGGNLQWPYREGNVAGPKAKPSNLIGFDVPPVYDYGRSVGVCIIGGYVYRGSLHPELVGKYIFGDHGNGRIWSLERTGSGVSVNQLTTLTRHGPGPKNGMGSFGLDAAGEIYVLSLAGTDLDGGRIYRLEKSNAGVPEPPQLLSQTGAFLDLETLAPAPGLIPYGVNQPLWSDGSDKRRWIAIPNDGNPNTPAERIAWSEDGAWGFPTGTVMVKHFEYPARRLETRFMVLGVDGEWYGFTYRWREDGSDAELLPDEGLDELVPSPNGPLSWRFPGRGECFQCHTQASGRVLGVTTRQLNGDFLYEKTGRSANQLVTLNRLGFFSPAIDETRLAGMLTARPQDDESVSLERRARSYLDVNCAHCHQPAAPTQAAFDLRLTTPPWHQNVVNVAPGNPLGIAGALLVAPSDIDLSALHARVASTAEGVAMPPIAKSLADPEGLDLLQRWIASLDPAIAPTGPVSGVPPSDHVAPTLSLSHAGGGGPLVTGPFEVTLSASKPIFGLTASDFEVENGSVTSVSGSGQTWTVAVVPGAPGEGSLSIGADRVADAVGNANNADTAPFAFDFRPPTGPVELLPNGGFESGLEGWDSGGSVSASGLARSGTGAVSVGGSSYIVVTVPVTALQNYVYSGWTVAATPGATAEAGLTFWDGNGVWIHDRTAALAPGGSYERFELAITAPVGATHVSVWILAGAGGGVRVDDLSFVADGSGEPRPQWQPGMTNYLENGGFESGLTSWDAGGQATPSTQARTGSGAARLGGDSFFVQTRPVAPREVIALQGAYFTQALGQPVEVGFSFWDAEGNWVTDRYIELTASSVYDDFLVDTAVPEGATSVAVWAWSGAGSAAIFDDFVLFRPAESGGGGDVNLFSNGGFESGSIDPWDTGGTSVALVSDARSGVAAAQLGSNAFIVHNQAVQEGEIYLFSGYYRTPTLATAEREAGFTFWGTGGEWLGNVYAALPPSAAYAAFEVDAAVPAGAAAVSVWVWSGEGASIVVDDLRLERVADPDADAGDAAAAFEEDSVEVAAALFPSVFKSEQVSAPKSNQLDAPQLAGPAGGASPGGTALSIGPGSVQLAWRPDDRANWHEIYLARNGSLYERRWVSGAPELGENGEPVFRFDTSELPPGDYQWWVRSYAPVTGTGAWSAQGSFEIACEALAAPSMPGGQTEYLGQWPRWLEIEGFEQSATWVQFELLRGGATLKQLWVGVTERGRAASYDRRTGAGDAGFAILPDGDYQWRARVWSPCHGSSEWSVPQGLSISGTDCSGELAAPAAGQIDIRLDHGFTGASGTGNSPVVTVSPGAGPPASWYQLWIGRAEDGAEVLSKWYPYASAYEPEEGGIYRLEAGQRLAPGSYFAYVRGYDGCGYGAWSGAVPFTVEAPLSREVTGVDVAFDGDGALRALWDGLPGIDWYQVWISSDGVAVFDRWLEGGREGYLGQVEGVGRTEFRGPTGSAVHAPGNYAFWVRTWSAGSGFGPWASDLGVSPVNLSSAPTITPTVVVDRGRPRIRWSAATSAGGYEIYLSLNGVFYHRETLMPKDLVRNEASRTRDGAPPLEFRTHWLPVSGSYRVWVRVQGGTRFGPWSEPVDFVLP